MHKNLTLYIFASLVWIAITPSISLAYDYARDPSGTEILTEGSSEFVDYIFSGTGDDTTVFYEWDISDPATTYFALRAYEGPSNFDPYVQSDCYTWSSAGSNDHTFTTDLPINDYYKIRILGFSDSLCENQTAQGNSPEGVVNLEYNEASIIFSIVEDVPPPTPPVAPLVLTSIGTTTCVMTATSMDCVNTTEEDYDYTVMMGFAFMIFIGSLLTVLYLKN